MPTVTLDTLKTRVKAYGYGTVDDSMIEVFLNQAYSEVAGSFKWSWLEKSGTVVTATGAPYTLLPADLQWFGRLDSRSDGVPAPMYVDEMDFRDYMPNREFTTGTGKPRHFSTFEGRFNWYPTPDAVYTYGIYYWRSITPLSSGSPTSLISDGDVDVLVLGALQRWAMRENDMAKMQTYGAQFEASVAQMMRNEKARQQQTIRRVKMPDHYHGLYDTDYGV